MAFLVNGPDGQIGIFGLAGLYPLCLRLARCVLDGRGLCGQNSELMCRRFCLRWWLWLCLVWTR